MAKRYTPADLLQNTVYGVEYAASRVQQAKTEQEVRKAMVGLRLKVKLLELRALAALEAR